MEKMYEKIINGYKRQLNESYSSGDEAIDEISDEFKMEVSQDPHSLKHPKKILNILIKISL